jgi:hypothetical protein
MYQAVRPAGRRLRVATRTVTPEATYRLWRRSVGKVPEVRRKTAVTAAAQAAKARWGVVATRRTNRAVDRERTWTD